MKEVSCLFIRHGKTKGNTEKRYVGCKTDEPLLEESVEELINIRPLLNNYALYEKVFISPMLRCQQTKEALIPNIEQIIIEDFRETDFGQFENKNYHDLCENENYQRWIDSNGTIAFPDGESRDEFIQRTVSAFRKALIEVNNCEGKVVPFIVHGGSIMAIMSELTGMDYFDFQINCNEGYLVKCSVGEDNIDVISYNRISFGCDS